LKQIRLPTLLLIMALQCAMPVGLLHASEHTAVDVVAHFQSALLSSMKDAKQLGFKGRFERLGPEVERSHDLPRVARLAIGKHWRSLDGQQQRRFINTFTHLVIATYAHQFHAFSGESFVRKTVRPLKHGRMLVRTELIKADGQPVHLDYILHQHHGRWLIINIIANGVSDLALKRAEYASVLSRDGIERLLAMLQRKITQYE